MLGIPAYRGQVHYGHVMQMASLSSAVFMAKGGLSLRGMLFPDTQFVFGGRNRILNISIKDESDWVLMCDADTFVADASHLVRMVAEAHKTDAAVIASPTKLRGRPGYNVLPADTHKNLMDADAWKGQVIEVDRIGTACMAIRLDWVRNEWPEQPWFEARCIPGAEPGVLGEDVWFCDGVKKRGGKILADGRFEPVHVGA